MPTAHTFDIAPTVYGPADKVTDVVISLTMVLLALYGWIRYFN